MVDWSLTMVEQPLTSGADVVWTVQEALVSSCRNEVQQSVLMGAVVIAQLIVLLMALTVWLTGERGNGESVAGEAHCQGRGEAVRIKVTVWVRKRGWRRRKGGRGGGSGSPKLGRRQRVKGIWRGGTAEERGGRHGGVDGGLGVITATGAVGTLLQGGMEGPTLLGVIAAIMAVLGMGALTVAGLGVIAAILALGMEQWTMFVWVALVAEVLVSAHEQPGGWRRRSVAVRLAALVAVLYATGGGGAEGRRALQGAGYRGGPTEGQGLEVDLTAAPSTAESAGAAEWSAEYRAAGERAVTTCKEGVEAMEGVKIAAAAAAAEGVSEMGWAEERTGKAEVASTKEGGEMVNEAVSLGTLENATMVEIMGGEVAEGNTRLNTVNQSDTFCLEVRRSRSQQGAVRLPPLLSGQGPTVLTQWTLCLLAAGVTVVSSGGEGEDLMQGMGAANGGAHLWGWLMLAMVVGAVAERVQRRGPMARGRVGGGLLLALLLCVAMTVVRAMDTGEEQEDNRAGVMGVMGVGMATARAIADGIRRSRRGEGDAQGCETGAAPLAQTTGAVAEEADRNEDHSDGASSTSESQMDSDEIAQEMLAIDQGISELNRRMGTGEGEEVVDWQEWYEAACEGDNYVNSVESAGGGESEHGQGTQPQGFVDWGEEEDTEENEQDPGEGAQGVNNNEVLAALVEGSVGDAQPGLPAAQEEGAEGRAEGEREEAAPVKDAQEPAAQSMEDGWGKERCYNEDDYAGDAFGKGQGAGLTGWVFTFMNIQRFKKTEGQAGARGNSDGPIAVKRFWKEMGDAGAVVVGLSDGGLEVGPGKGGQYDRGYTSGKEYGVARDIWGGEGTVWGVASGTRTSRGGTAAGLVECEAVLAADGRLRGRAQVEAVDTRGWGRYVIMMVDGAEGVKNKLCVVSVHSPSKPWRGEGGSVWERQAELMKGLRKTEQGIEENPRAQLIRDIHRDMREIITKYRTYKVGFVLGGDLNQEWGHGPPVGGVYDEWRGLAEMMGMKEVSLVKHGKLFWTNEGNSKTTPDHIMVSSYLLGGGALQRVGVLQGVRHNSTTHRALMMQLEVGSWLGLGADIKKVGARAPKVIKPKLYINKVLEVLDYQEEAGRLWDSWGMTHKVSKLLEDGRGLISGGCLYEHLGEEFQARMDKTMGMAQQVLLQAQRKVVGREKVETRQRSRRKEPFSEQLRQGGEKLRELQRLLHREKTGGTSRKAKARAHGKWLEKKFGWSALNTPKSCGAEDQWREWRHKVNNKIIEVKAGLQVRQREEWRILREKNREWVKAVVKSGKWKQVFNKVRGREFLGIDRDMLVVEREGERVVVTDPEDIGRELSKHFREWWGEGEDKWFQKWGGDTDNRWVDEIHPLFEDSERGFRMRSRVVNGPRAESEEEKEAHMEWIEELKQGLPERTQWVLDLYKRKYLVKEGKVIEEEDYRGVMDEIGTLEWEAYLRDKSGNKASDYHGMHINLLKALGKVYTDAQVDKAIEDRKAELAAKAKAAGEKVGETGDKGEGSKVKAGWGRTRKGWGDYKQQDAAVDVSEGMRELLNVSLVTGHVYAAWKEEVLCTIPKVSGSTHIGDTRPIGLLVIMRNAMMGLVFRRVRVVWERLGVISATQLGGQRGMGTEEARMLQNYTFEYCYLHNEDVATCTEDKKHAYDSPTQTVGFQMGMMRLGLPEKLIRLDHALNVQGRIMVRYAYGMSPEFKRGGDEGCGNGAVQGGEDSTQKWAIYEDPFNTHWEQSDGGVEVQVSEYNKIKVKGGGFVDDKKPMEKRVEDINSWLSRSADFGYFHGVDVRPKKCEGQANVTGEDGMAVTLESLDKMKIPLGGEGVLQDLQMKEAGEAIKTLGEWGNPLLLWAESLDKVKVEMDQAAVFFKASMTREVAKRVWETCLVPVVVYRLLFATFSEADLKGVMAQAWGAYKARLLPRSAPNNLCHAYGVGDMWNKINIAKLVSVLRGLSSRHVQARELTRGAIYQEQMSEGVAQGVLEIREDTGTGWNGTMIGRLREWMWEYNIEVRGLGGMPMLREGDQALVDMADSREKKATVAAGSWVTEAWRISEVVTQLGGTMQALGRGGRKRPKGGGRWAGKLRSTKEAGAAKWLKEVSGMVEQWRENYGELGRWLRASVRLGAVVCWRGPGTWGEGEGGVWHVGRVCRLQSGGVVSRWSEKVGVNPWRRKGAVEGRSDQEGEGEDVREELDCWSSVNIVGEVWVEGGDGGANTQGEMEVERLVEAGQLRMVGVEGTLHEGWNSAGGEWVVDEEEHVLEGWETEDPMEEKVEDEEDEDEGGQVVVSFEGLHELVGVRGDDGGAGEFQMQWRELQMEAMEMENQGKEVLLLTYSDGSHKPGAVHRGTYGWAVRGLEGGKEYDGLWGGGLVHGQHEDITSTRAEALGALAVLLLLDDRGWEYRVCHRLDNQAVTQQVERLERGKRLEGEVMTLRECMHDSDPDVWGEMSHVWAVRDSRWGAEGRADLEWHRGHPERRMPGQSGRAKWTGHDRWMYRVDEVAEEMYGRMEVRESWWTFPHAPQWEVYWRGRALKGKVRDRLKVAVMKERFMRWQGDRVNNAMLKCEEGRRMVSRGGTNRSKVGLWGKGERTKWWAEQTRRTREWQERGFYRRFGDELVVKGSKNIEDVVLRVRALAGFLATRVSPQMGQVDEEDSACRFCGAAGESNHHVMWVCTASPMVVMERRKMVRAVGKLWMESGLGVDEVEVLAAMHSLGDGGGVVYGGWEELSVGLGEMREGCRQHEGKLTGLLHDWMEGQASKHMRRGDMCNGMWVELLGDMGVEDERAAGLVDRVSAAVVTGQCSMWRVFMEQWRVKESGGEAALINGKTLQRAALEEVLSRLSGTQGGTLLEGQDRVLRMRTAKKEAWLKEVARVRDGGGQWRRAVGTAYAVVDKRGRIGLVNGGGAMTIRQYMELKRDEEGRERGAGGEQIGLGRGADESGGEEGRGGGNSEGGVGLGVIPATDRAAVEGEGDRPTMVGYLMEPRRRQLLRATMLGRGRRTDKVKGPRGRGGGGRAGGVRKRRRVRADRDVEGSGSSDGGYGEGNGVESTGGGGMEGPALRSRGAVRAAGEESPGRQPAVTTRVEVGEERGGPLANAAMQADRAHGEKRSASRGAGGQYLKKLKQSRGCGGENPGGMGTTRLSSRGDQLHPSSAQDDEEEEAERNADGDGGTGAGGGERCRRRSDDGTSSRAGTRLGGSTARRDGGGRTGGGDAEDVWSPGAVGSHALRRQGGAGGGADAGQRNGGAGEHNVAKKGEASRGPVGAAEGVTCGLGMGGGEGEGEGGGRTAIGGGGEVDAEPWRGDARVEGEGSGTVRLRGGAEDDSGGGTGGEAGEHGVQGTPKPGRVTGLYGAREGGGGLVGGGVAPTGGMGQCQEGSRVQGARGDGSILEVHRDADARGEDRGACWQGPKGGGLVVEGSGGVGQDGDRNRRPRRRRRSSGGSAFFRGNTGDSPGGGTATEEAAGGGGGGQGLPGLVLRGTVSEACSRGGGLHLQGRGHKAPRLLGQGEEVGGEPACGSDEGDICRDMGGGAEECGTGGGGGGEGGTGFCGRGAMLHYILQDEQGERGEGVRLQGQGWQPSGGALWGVGQEGGQGCDEAAEVPEVGWEEGRVQGVVWGLDAGEPSGGPGEEGLHGGLGAGSCEEGGGPLCIWPLLQEANTHLDQCDGVDTEGGDRGWEVRQQVRSRVLGREGQVGAQTCTGGGVTEGESRQGEEGDEAGYPTSAAQGGSGGGAVVSGCVVVIEPVLNEDLLAIYVRGAQEAKRRRLAAAVIEEEQGGSEGVT